jgi:hypothetical protein
VEVIDTCNEVLYGTVAQMLGRRHNCLASSTQVAELLTGLTIRRAFDIYSLLDNLTYVSKPCVLLVHDLHSVISPHQEQPTKPQPSPGSPASVEPLLSQFAISTKNLVSKNGCSVFFSNTLLKFPATTNKHRSRGTGDEAYAEVVDLTILCSPNNASNTKINIGK